MAAIVVLLPSLVYALYRLEKNGPIPHDESARATWLAKRVPEYGAISFLNRKAGDNDVVWLCGGEELAYQFRGEMIGDQSGTARFALITSARDEAALDRRAALLNARYLLVVKRSCSVPALQSSASATRFRLRYADATTEVFERVSH